jgi:hypothetical protein
MTFDQIWEASRYNWAFWLSHILGICGIVLLPAIAVKIRSKARRRICYAVVLISMTILITGMTVQSVQLKWKARWAAAQTEAQQQAASRDGANLAFSPIIGGFKALVYIGIGTAALLIARKKRNSNSRLQAIDAKASQPDP